MPDIFISYAHDDIELVEHLSAALVTRGWSVWWDTDLSSRSQFPTEIENNLARCKVTIAIWSRAANTSRWVKEEANYALEHDKLLPVVIDASRPPFGFQLVDTCNLEDWAKTHRLSDLEHLITKISEFTPPPLGHRQYLFGRQDELLSLQRLRQVAAQSRIAVLSGEPGVGKTAILEDYAEW